VLLDQKDETKKIVISGNNQLLKGSIFALITLAWFSFLFAFTNMNWQNFTPLAPFSEVKEKDKFIFYFICFSFFISSLIFSLIFYKNNLQPVDILLRFAIILIIFVFVYGMYQLISFGLLTQKGMLTGGLLFIGSGILFQLANIILTFLLFYLLFYPLILVFSRFFYNGFFGLAGFILCFFITAIFHVSLYFLANLEAKLAHTSLPMADIIVILFFTLTAFGIGVVAGEEKKAKSIGKAAKNRIDRSIK
jgi:hypothetical protein